MPDRRGPGYWSLVADGEPFRLLFPLGVMIGLFGVLMWPFYIWNLTPLYPGQLHARIMIQGFQTCFVIGFLTTALPRLLDVPKLRIWETLAFAAALCGVTALNAAGRPIAADQVFFATICGLILVLAMRFVLRRDTPPPGFVLVGMGLFCALAGSGLFVLGGVAPNLLPWWGVALGRLLLYQGYLVFPIMGIGAFLLPRFFGMPSRQEFPTTLTLPPGWLPKAAFALACGLTVFAGFVVEAIGEARWGCALRAVGIGVYFFREIPAHRGEYAGGSLALGVRLALFSIPLAYLLMAIWPGQIFALLHLLFISGFSLLTLVVASRVILGHSGQTQKLRASMRPVLIMIGLLTLAMLTRVTADWMPDIRMGHYAYAAVSWAAGVVVWAWAILPGVCRADAEE